MKLQEIRQLYQSILTMVEKKVYDSYLLKYIPKPVIDENKLLIVISIMSRLKQSEKEIQNIALSTMLIQIALDTHESITQTAQDDKTRQLTVLAGDYYSGLYYKYLADSHDISMIRALSYGVKEVNEHKAFLYQSNHNLDKFFNDLKIIESSLIAKVADHFNMQESFEVISDYLLYKRLLREKHKYLKGEHSFVFEKVGCLLGTNRASQQQSPDILAIIERKLDSMQETIDKGMSRIPYLNEYLESRIFSVIKQQQTLVKTFVEEG